VIMEDLGNGKELITETLISRSKKHQQGNLEL
jgi:hypothetical protein